MANDVYRSVSLPSMIRRGVELAAKQKFVCNHKWVKVKDLDCYVCKLCDVYSAYSVVKIPLHRDEVLSAEIVDASHQYAVGYNMAVAEAAEALPWAVGAASFECEAWQKKKNIDEFYPRKNNIKRFMPSRADLNGRLTVARAEQPDRFSGSSDVQRSGVSAGLNAVLASYDRYAEAHNNVFKTKQHNREATEKNKKLAKEYEEAKAANPDKKIKKPEFEEMERTYRSDLRAMKRDVYDPQRLFSKKKDRQKKPIVLPVLEKIKSKNGGTAFKFPGIKTWLKPKRLLPEGLDIKNGVLVETTQFVAKNTLPQHRTFSLHLTVRHLIPPPAGAQGGYLGVDVGIDVAIATSNGDLIAYPEEMHAINREIRAWQRLKAKRRHGSKGWSEAVNTIAALWKLLAAHRKQFITETAQKHCRENCVIGLEKLNNRGMRGSASGTRRNPGRRVAQKRGLNRGLAFLSPAMIAAAYRRAALKTGTRIVFVSAKNTSIECAACGHTNKKNRESQSVFRCLNPKCGYSANADINAAINILARAATFAAADRLAADARTKSVGGSGKSSLRTDEPSLRTVKRLWQLSAAGEAESTSTGPNRKLSRL